MVCELYLNKTIIEEKEITQKKLRMLIAWTRWLEQEINGLKKRQEIYHKLNIVIKFALQISSEIMKLFY